MVEFCFPLSLSNGAPAAQEKFGDPSESEPLGAAWKQRPLECDRGQRFKKLRLCTSFDQFFFSDFARNESTFGICEGLQDVRLTCG